MQRQRKRQRLEKAHRGKNQSEIDWCTARTAQYTTQFLLPQVARCIDDIVHDNYTVPVNANVANAGVTVAPSVLYDYDAAHFALRPALTQDELQRLQSIISIYSVYLQTGAMRLSALRNALKPAQYADMTAAFKTREHPEEHMYGDGIPFVLKDFNLKLRKADMKFGQYERCTSRRDSGRMKIKQSVLAAMENKSESLYEEALEDLEETFGCAQRGDFGPEMFGQLEIWMDRPIDFGLYRDISIDCVGMPRVRGSKSLNALDAGLPKLSKRLKRNECALKALLVASCEIAFVLPEVQVDPVIAAAQSQKLKLMLGRLKKSND